MELLEKRQLLAGDFSYDPGDGETGPRQDRIPGEIVVQFAPGASAEAIRGIYQANQAAELERLYGQERTRRIAVPVAAADNVLRALANNPFVDFAEPNYVAYRTSVPNDPFLSYQWSFGADIDGGINLGEAWSLTTGRGSTIAVLDTGVAYENYSDATGSYFASPDLLETQFVPGYDFVNGDAHANDDQGHGTHVAGTIAQSTNNGVGVAGVAHGAALMPVKVLGADGSGSYASIASGIRWAADQGADVMNLSLGGANGSTLLEEAVAYAHGLGVTIVAAAGNDGLGSVSFPAAYNDHVIAVSATRYDKQLATYSNYGASIDLAAPGGDVAVDQNGDGFGDGILQSTFSDSPDAFGYYFYQGTSMAAPHVAGVAGLIASLGVSNPVDVRQILLSSATDLGDEGIDSFYGHGLLNAAAAVTAATQINKDPVAEKDSVSGSEDQTLVIDVLSNDTDPDGDTISVGAVQGAVHGDLVIQNDGTILYQPKKDFFGFDQFQYTVSDGRGGTAVGNVEVHINSVADVSVRPVNAAVLEGDTELVSFGFELRLDQPASADYAFDWVVDGFQTSANDFENGIPFGSTLITAGTSHAAINLLVVGDTEIEPNESFHLRLSSAPQEVQVAQQVAVGTILNDDGTDTFEYFYGAVGERNLYGSVANSYEATYHGDYLAEVLTEESYQRNRRSRLEHSWDFEVQPGDLDTEFVLVAGHDSNVESFQFEYDLRDGAGWRALLVLQDKEIQAYSVPVKVDTAGIVSVRVLDTDRQRGESSTDSLIIDQIGFVSKRSTPLPPLVTLNALDATGSELGNEVLLVEFSIDRSIPEDLAVYYDVAGTATHDDYLETLTGEVVIRAGEQSTVLQITPIDDVLEEGTESIQISVVGSDLYGLASNTKSELAILDDDQLVRRFYPKGENTVSGSVVGGSYTSLLELDGSREMLEERSTGGRPTSRTSFLDHRWSFDVEQAQSFGVNAYRPVNREDEDFIFQYSVDSGQSWTPLVSIGSETPTSYLVDLPNVVSGSVDVRVVDTDPLTRGDGDRDGVSVDQMFFSTDASGVTNSTLTTVDTITSMDSVLNLGRSRMGVLSVEEAEGRKTTVRGREFRAVVQPGQSFGNDKSWKTKRLEVRDGKLVQIASDGHLTMIVEGGGWRNFVTPSDVNHDQGVTALDVLAVINEMSSRQYSDHLTGEMKDEMLLLTAAASFFDQNGDGICSALDALRVINDLNRQSTAEEGEAFLTPFILQRGETPIQESLNQETPVQHPMLNAPSRSNPSEATSGGVASTGEIFRPDRLPEGSQGWNRRQEIQSADAWTADRVDALFAKEEIEIGTLLAPSLT